MSRCTITIEHSTRPHHRMHLKVRKAVNIGLNISIVLITVVAAVMACRSAWDTMTARIGTFGGEVLVFPALALMFYVGYSFGTEHERDRWTEREMP